MLEEIKVTACGFSAQSHPLTTCYERFDPMLQSLGERTCDKIRHSALLTLVKNIKECDVICVCRNPQEANCAKNITDQMKGERWLQMPT